MHQASGPLEKPPATAYAQSTLSTPPYSATPGCRWYPSRPDITPEWTLTRVLGRNDADVVVLYRIAARTVDDPAYRAAVTNNLAALPAANVASEQTCWPTRSPQFVSADGREAYAVIQ